MSSVGAGLRMKQTCVSSGLLNADAAIKAAPGIIEGIMVYTDGTNNATLTVYDNASAATGDVAMKMVVKGADLIGGLVDLSVETTNGIYADISGTGATYIVYYK